MHEFDTLPLGRLKQDAGTPADGEAIVIRKHKWCCGWYWSFGYLGNEKCQFNFDSLLYAKKGSGGAKYLASELFVEPRISDADWWVVRDLFVQAYALQKAAEVYRYGGHQTARPGITDIIRDDAMVARINKDLRKVLDTVWDIMCKAVHGEAK